MIDTIIALAMVAMILNYGYDTFIAQATGWKVFDAKNTLAYSSVTEKKSLMTSTQGVDRNDVDGKWAKVGKFFFLTCGGGAMTSEPTASPPMTAV